MNANDQGARRDRYHAIPRTLIFLRSSNPDSGAEEILLLKGAPNKRLWANKYNGLGGHVEADEDIYAAALREVAEEAGLTVTELTLRGVVNINTGSDENGQRPGVLMFVFIGNTAERRRRNFFFWREPPGRPTHGPPPRGQRRGSRPTRSATIHLSTISLRSCHEHWRMENPFSATIGPMPQAKCAIALNNTPCYALPEPAFFLVPLAMQPPVNNPRHLKSARLDSVI